MKRYVQAGLLATLIASGVGVLWLGVSGPESGGQMITAQQMNTPTIAEDKGATAPVATNVVSQPNVSEPAPVAKAVALTAEERQVILAEFVKAADKDMAKVQKSIDEARNAGAPAEQIAVQESKLRMMQQFKQDTLARNAS
jgi:hypothetical protein